MCQPSSEWPHRIGHTTEGFDRDLRSSQFIAHRSIIRNPQSRRVISHLGPRLSGGANHRLLAHRPTERLAPARRQRRAAGRTIELSGQFAVALPDERSTVEGGDFRQLVCIRRQRTSNDRNCRRPGVRRFHLRLHRRTEGRSLPPRSHHSLSAVAKRSV